MLIRFLGNWESFNITREPHFRKDIDLEKDFDPTLTHTSKIDPKILFRYNEKLLKDNRMFFKLESFKRVCYVLDKIYASYDENNPTITVKRLTEWSKKVQVMLQKGPELFGTWKNRVDHIP